MQSINAPKVSGKFTGSQNGKVEKKRNPCDVFAYSQKDK